MYTEEVISIKVVKATSSLVIALPNGRCNNKALGLGDKRGRGGAHTKEVNLGIKVVEEASDLVIGLRNGGKKTKQEMGTLLGHHIVVIGDFQDKGDKKNKQGVCSM